MLEMLNMTLIRCPVGFSEEIIAVFHMKKSQIDTENDKIPKIFNFQKVYAFSPKFSTDFVDWNVKKGQQGKSVLSSRGFSH